MTKSKAAIGVFDSGLGGLTVLSALTKALPHEDFIYLGDTARLPYGAKSPETIARYVEQNIAYLEQLGVKAVVVACNSASSVLDLVVGFGDEPVFGVIGPGAEAALKVSSSGRVGVMGTLATVNHGAYVQALKERRADVVVVQQACPLLVPLVEEGWIDDPLTNLIIHRYVQPLVHAQVDTIVLGCTHYPVLKAAIQKVVGGGISLVDSADAVAQHVRGKIAGGEIPAADSSRTGEIRLLVTDRTEHFTRIAAQLLHPLPSPALELVNLTE